MPASKYHRVLLKISGSFFTTPKEPLISLGQLAKTAQILATAYQRHQPLELVIVTGAGNLIRGRDINQVVSRSTADALGMMSTIINALALGEALKNTGVEAEATATIHMPQIIPTYTRQGGLKILTQSKILIVGGGTGLPYLSTDTAAVVIAKQLGCEVVLKATDVDGVFSADPKKDTEAKRYEILSFDEALVKKLQVMDQAAFALAREVGQPIVVFNFTDLNNLDRLLSRERVGTLIKNSKTKILNPKS